MLEPAPDTNHCVIHRRIGQPDGACSCGCDLQKAPPKRASSAESIDAFNMRLEKSLQLKTDNLATKRAAEEKRRCSIAYSDTRKLCHHASLCALLKCYVRTARTEMLTFHKPRRSRADHAS